MMYIYLHVYLYLYMFRYRQVYKILQNYSLSIYPKQNFMRHMNEVYVIHDELHVIYYIMMYDYI